MQVPTLIRRGLNLATLLMDKNITGRRFGKFMIIPIFETLLIVWLFGGLLFGAVYLDNKSRITKRYKHILFSIIGGPVVWGGWVVWLFLKMLGKFEDWLTV